MKSQVNWATWPSAYVMKAKMAPGEPVAVRTDNQPHDDHQQEKRNRLGDTARLVRVHEHAPGKSCCRTRWRPS